MTEKFINYNGNIIPAVNPVLGISNRGFRYGDGLFETIRVAKGSLCFAELHAGRLQSGMNVLKMNEVERFNADFIEKQVKALLKRNQTGPHARVRLTVFREGEGLYTPSGNKPGYAFESSKLDSALYKSSNKGLIMDIYEEIPKPVNSLSNLKTCNSLPFVMAGLYRIGRSLDDVFILNQHGFLCETMSSNVFVFYDDKLYTPALSEGCVAGVMRSVVIRLAAENGLSVVEAQINPAILNEAEEVFITNAVKGIQWVMGFYKKRYFNEVSRFLLEKLNNLF